jgi:hypothetical protein
MAVAGDLSPGGDSGLGASPTPAPIRLLTGCPGRPKPCDLSLTLGIAGSSLVCARPCIRSRRDHPVSKMFPQRRWRFTCDEWIRFAGPIVFTKRKGNMPRFELNRRSTFILALCVSLMCFAVRPSHSDDGSAGRIIGEPRDTELPYGVGDPDVPETTSKYVKSVQAGRGSMSSGWRSAGDSRPTSVMMWRLRVVLSNLRLALGRF